MLAGFGEQCQQPGNTPTPASQRPLMMRHAEEQCSPALASNARRLWLRLRSREPSSTVHLSTTLLARLSDIRAGAVNEACSGDRS